MCHDNNISSVAEPTVKTETLSSEANFNELAWNHRYLVYTCGLRKL